MPYIKIISVRNSVAGCLKYIADPDKTNEQLFLTGLNCSEDISIAEKEFCLTYQHYSHKNFYDKPQENGKSPVKAFHIIQSFKARCDLLRRDVGQSSWSATLKIRAYGPLPVARWRW